MAVARSDSHGGHLALWRLDLERSVFSPLSSSPLVQAGVVFSPDGTRIAVDVDHGVEELAVGGGAGNRIDLGDRARGGFDSAVGWSRDGRYFVFNIATERWILPLAGGAKPFLWGAGHSGDLSPDGKWVVWVTGNGRGNRAAVYVEPLSSTPSTGAGQILVSTGRGGREPRWSKDGKEVYYISADNKLMAAPVNQWPPLTMGIPKPLFEVPAGVDYDLSPDGKRFLVNLPLGEVADPPLTVLLNWPSALPK